MDWIVIWNRRYTYTHSMERISWKMRGEEGAERRHTGWSEFRVEGTTTVQVPNTDRRVTVNGFWVGDLVHVGLGWIGGMRMRGAQYLPIGPPGAVRNLYTGKEIVNLTKTTSQALSDRHPWLRFHSQSSWSKRSSSGQKWARRLVTFWHLTQVWWSGSRSAAIQSRQW